MKLLWAILHFRSFLKKVYSISPWEWMISRMSNKDYSLFPLPLSEILTVFDIELVAEIVWVTLSVIKDRAATILWNLLLEYF